MLPTLWLLLLILRAPAAEGQPEPIEFERDVRPILEKRCQPCHFPGGKMHEKLPFDQAATIHKLGTKLFTRIKDEEEREVIRRFLSGGVRASQQLAQARVACPAHRELRAVAQHGHAAVLGVELELLDALDVQ